MKYLPNAVKILDGDLLMCPSCKYKVGLELESSIGLGDATVTPVIGCGHCGKTLALVITGCKNGHIHIKWAEIDPELDIPTFYICGDNTIYPPSKVSA